MTRVDPILVVHGGAGDLPSDEDRERYREGVAAALQAGLAVLARGARAAVREAVAYMEEHTIMNAGRGAALASDGSAILDAGFMDGATRRYGAVTGVRRSLHPVVLAEHLLDEGDYGRFLGPPEVDELAAELGLPACEPHELITERARSLWRSRRGGDSAAGGAPTLDTVGAVALDGDGHLAAAVSTGGMSLKRPGRVGDSPVVGAGFYADDRAGACVTTGVGEVLLREGSARHCVGLVAGGTTPRAAAEAALDALVDYHGDVRGTSGLILVAASGAVVLVHNTREMTGGWARPGGESCVRNVWRDP